MTRVKALGYLGIGVSDMAAWEEFANDVLGLATTQRASDGPVRFTMDDHDARIVAHPSGEDDILYAGWEVDDAAEVEGMVERLRAAGETVAAGSTEEVSARGVEKLIYCEDPDGIRTEIYCGPARSGNGGFQSPAGVSGFVTGDQGFGHIALGTSDPDAKLDFYRNKLGLLLSDHIHLSAGPDATMTATFFHCNPRHHTLAIVPAPLPKKLHHFMLLTESLDDVGRALDIAASREVPLASALGRHTNDHMVSFYLFTPSGFEVEFGWGGLEIDDSTWQLKEYDGISLWGHHRVAGP